MGVNTINLHLSYARKWFHDGIYRRDGEDPREMMLNGLDDAQKHGFRYVRFFAGPGYPKTMDLFYLKDKDAYWENMDAVVEECRKRDLKLVPSFGVVSTFSGYHGEPAQAVLDPNSKGHKGSYGYIEEFVTRYRDDPTILMWEIQNELMLHADVNMAGKGVNPGVFTEGKAPRAKKTIEDSLSYDQIVRIYKEMTAFIKSIDKNHLVTSGDSRVRPECTSRRETFPDFTYRTDTLDEWIANNINSQPAPLDVYSLHMYGPYGVGGKGEVKQMGCANNMELFEKTITAMHDSGRPVFIGEFGKNYEDGKDTDPQDVLDMMKMFDRSGVSLMCFWAWHFKWQKATFNATSESQPELARAFRALSEKYGN
ncbi:MAG: cellulase family glycosylhydrolase [Verrucomicrobia bacterium]|nr:cellulase family glycosylhydrolase [Verrucomicrobiota bacterium]